MMKNKKNRKVKTDKLLRRHFSLPQMSETKRFWNVFRSRAGLTSLEGEQEEEKSGASDKPSRILPLSFSKIAACLVALFAIYTLIEGHLSDPSSDYEQIGMPQETISSAEPSEPGDDSKYAEKPPPLESYHQATSPADDTSLADEDFGNGEVTDTIEEILHGKLGKDKFHFKKPESKPAGSTDPDIIFSRRGALSYDDIIREEKEVEADGTESTEELLSPALEMTEPHLMASMDAEDEKEKREDTPPRESIASSMRMQNKKRLREAGEVIERGNENKLQVRLLNLKETAAFEGALGSAEKADKEVLPGYIAGKGEFNYEGLSYTLETEQTFKPEPGKSLKLGSGFTLAVEDIDVSLIKLLIRGRKTSSGEEEEPLQQNLQLPLSKPLLIGPVQGDSKENYLLEFSPIE